MPYVAEIVTEAAVATGLEITMKSANVASAGTVRVAGADAIAGLLVVNMTTVSVVVAALEETLPLT